MTGDDNVRRRTELWSAAHCLAKVTLSFPSLGTILVSRVWKEGLRHSTSEPLLFMGSAFLEQASRRKGR